MTNSEKGEEKKIRKPQAVAISNPFTKAQILGHLRFHIETLSFFELSSASTPARTKKKEIR